LYGFSPEMNIQKIAIRLLGEDVSPQNVEVRARVEAFVEKVLFTESATVNQGDPLYLLDTKPFLERLEAAKGGLALENTRERK